MAGAKDDATKRLRMTLYIQPDPEIRQRAIELADVSVREEYSRVLYASVNDSSDQVRLTAYSKLLESSDEKIQSEAQNIWKDDSVPMIAEAIEKGLLKGTILKGLAHKSALIRAKTLAAIDPSRDVKVEDLSGVLADSDPRVQVALIQFASKRKLMLPAEFAAKVQASPFASVKKALKDFPLP
jgi:hypothetical protein